MTVQSATKFDVSELARAYAQWDIDALLDLYADDVELVRSIATTRRAPRGCAMARSSSGACSSTAPPPA